MTFHCWNNICVGFLFSFKISELKCNFSHELCLRAIHAEEEHLLNLKYNKYLLIHLNQEIKYFNSATKLLNTNEKDLKSVCCCTKSRLFIIETIYHQNESLASQTFQPTFYLIIKINYFSLNCCQVGSFIYSLTTFIKYFENALHILKCFH